MKEKIKRIIEKIKDIFSLHCPECGGRISACCKGKRKTVGNYIWRYKEGFDV